MLGCSLFHESWEAPMNEYDGKQFVGIDLHRQRSVIVRQSESGEQLSAVRIVNDPVALGLQLEDAGADPEVVLEATYGWYWAVDVLQARGAQVHLAHPLGVKGFRYRRVKNDVRDAGIWLICCGWAGCPRLGSHHRRHASCGSWCATEPNSLRSDRGSKPRSMPYWPKPAC